MINQNPIVTERGYPIHRIHRLCWSSIFGGAFVGVGLTFLLHLYGVAISLSAFSSSQHGAAVLAIGGLIGMLIGVIAAMGAAGFVAGYLGRFHYYPIHGGVIYGFITWSLAIFLSAVMIGPLTHYVADYGNSLANPSMMDVPSADVSIAAQNNVAVVNGQKVVAPSPAELAWGGWIIFGMFFIGALSSCVGASCGIRCKREDDVTVTTV